MKKKIILLLIVLIIVSCSSGPKKIGMRGRFFQACPGTPNCVSSMDKRRNHYVAPINYTISNEDAFKRLIVVLNSMNKVTVLKQTPTYVYVVFRTPLMNFKDDVEFYLPSFSKIIHIRSASRIGFSDMGANRKRVELIRKRFNER